MAKDDLISLLRRNPDPVPFRGRAHVVDVLEQDPEDQPSPALFLSRRLDSIKKIRPPHHQGPFHVVWQTSSEDDVTFRGLPLFSMAVRFIMQCTLSNIDVTVHLPPAAVGVPGTRLSLRGLLRRCLRSFLKEEFSPSDIQQLLSWEFPNRAFLCP